MVLCSGKVYYELHEQREKLGLQDKVALVRVEQVGGLLALLRGADDADAITPLLAVHTAAVHACTIWGSLTGVSLALRFCW